MSILYLSRKKNSDRSAESFNDKRMKIIKHTSPILSYLVFLINVV